MQLCIEAYHRFIALCCMLMPHGQLRQFRTSLDDMPIDVHVYGAAQSTGDLTSQYLSELRTALM